MKYVAPYKQYLIKLQEKDQFRHLRQDHSDHDRKTLLDFSTNDYLNLSHHPEIIMAALDAAQQFGVGATGSRLLSGNRSLFEAFEKTIASDKKTEAALILNTGFQANVTILSSLLNQKVLKEKPVVFFDKLNHASLYQAVFLSGAELVRYHHLDLTHLADCLKKYHTTTRPLWIVSETLFGMDGDLTPLEEMIALAKTYRAGLYLDEAHAVGVFGQNGYGLSTTVDFADVPHVIMGTFSKAIGASGGYVACDHLLKDYFINQSPGFIYSTALSPMVIGATRKAWEKIKTLDQERQRLFSLAAKLKSILHEKGIAHGKSNSHIIPIIIGKESDTLEVHNALLKEGIMTSCIRPPTVPPGSSRLRIALTLKHQEKDLIRLTEALCAYL